MSASDSGSASGSTPLLPEEYESLIERMREAVDDAVPRNATVLVVSRGDDELLRLGPRRGLHFPQDEFGRYPGYHPEHSRSAIEMLESMRVRGGEYLLLPSTAFWWLDYYEGLRDHLKRRYPAPVESDDCMIFELTPTGVEAGAPDADTDDVSPATPSPAVAGPLDELLGALLPAGARVAVVAGDGARLPSFGDVRHVQDEGEAADADFLVLPAATGHRPPAGWRLVTSQRHLGDVYEKESAVGSSQPAAESGSANGEPRTANRAFWHRLRALLRP